MDSPSKVLKLTHLPSKESEDDHSPEQVVEIVLAVKKFGQCVEVSSSGQLPELEAEGPCFVLLREAVAVVKADG